MVVFEFLNEHLNKTFHFKMKNGVKICIGFYHNHVCLCLYIRCNTISELVLSNNSIKFTEDDFLKISSFNFKWKTIKFGWDLFF